MNYELNFENDKPQISFENTTNTIQFQAPQNVVGGTTNYKALSNKPKINGVELVDNKTLEELGIKQEYTASDIKFADGDTFQDKYNSGELKGEQGQDGYTPVKGVDYFDGKDGANGKDGSNGVSCTHSWSGTTLIITSASGTTSANLKGETGATGPQGIQGVRGVPGVNGTNGKDGVDGKTPVKGVDYYTEADKLEMVDLVLSALPSSEGVSY